MKVTNREIFEGKSALQELLRYRLPVRTSFQIAKLSRKFNEALKDIDEVRRNLIDKYGTASERGGKEVKVELKVGDVTTPNKDYPKFMKEFNDLLDLEVDMVADKIKLPDVIASTCDKCHHNMDRLLEIEPWILALLEKFMEV